MGWIGLFFNKLSVDFFLQKLVESVAGMPGGNAGQGFHIAHIEGHAAQGEEPRVKHPLGGIIPLAACLLQTIGGKGSEKERDPLLLALRRQSKQGIGRAFFLRGGDTGGGGMVKPVYDRVRLMGKRYVVITKPDIRVKEKDSALQGGNFMGQKAVFFRRRGRPLIEPKAGGRDFSKTGRAGAEKFI